MTSAREIKRSISIAGHRTSVSLEGPFWDTLKEIAEAEKLSTAALVARIDAARDPEGGSLSSAIRVFVLERLRARLGMIPRT
jgi:predicted DNA-binding ribbon-helix-helix protein